MRKNPIAIKDKIEQELNGMLENNIIKRVIERWVNSLTYVISKPDKSIRISICLDPRLLNKALVRPLYKIPPTEEINYKFSGAKFSSKLDAKHGYWSIKLDEESQLLTPFLTPFGVFVLNAYPLTFSITGYFSTRNR